MSGIVLLTKNILRRLLNKPLDLSIRTIVLTAVFFLFLMIFNLKGDEQIHIGITDLDQSTSSKHIVDLLKTYTDMEVYEMEEAYLNYYVENGDIPLGLVIPRGFEESLLNSSELPIELRTVYDETSFEWMDTWVNFETQYQYASFKYANGDISEYRKSLLERRTEKLMTISIKDQFQNNNSLNRGFGIYLLLLMLSTMTLSFQIVDEKNNGTFDRVGFSPIRRAWVTIAYILANLVLVAFQLILLLVMIRALPWWKFNGSYSILFLILFIFSLCAVTFGVLIASYSKSSSHANALMSVLLTPTCIIGGCFWPIDLMPDFMQRVAYLTPQRWTLDAISAAVHRSLSETVITSMVVVLSFTVLFSLVASRQFIKER